MAPGVQCSLNWTRLLYTARVTRYNELHGSCNSLHSSLHECRYMAQKALLKRKMVSLDLSLQRHLTGPLESALQDVFRSLLKHQWETNCKLRLPRFRARACAIARPAVAIFCAFPCTSQAAGVRSPRIPSGNCCY